MAAKLALNPVSKRLGFRGWGLGFHNFCDFRIWGFGLKALGLGVEGFRAATCSFAELLGCLDLKNPAC